MRGIRAGTVLIAVATLSLAACSSDAEPSATTTLEGAAATTSTTVGDQTTTSSGSSGGSSRATTTTTTTDGATTTTTDLGSSTTTSSVAPSTTTTGPPATVTKRPASPSCPQDLFVASGSRGVEYDAELAAFPSSGGEPLWRLPLGLDHVVSRTHDEVRVYVFLASGLLVALDAESCEEQWRFGLGTPGGVGLSEGVLVATDDRAVRAFDAERGIVLWTKDLTSGPPLAPLVLEDFAVVPAANVPLITGYSTIDGARLYDVSLDEWSGVIRGLTADFTAFYPVGNGRIAGRWIDDGEVLFEATLPFDPGPPRLFSGTLFVSGTGPGGAVIGAYDYDLGEEIWITDLGNSRSTQPVAPAIESGMVHVLDSSGILHHLDLLTGAPLASGTYPAAAVRAEFDDLLFTVADRGTITVYTLDEEAVAKLPTGADGASRVTELDLVGSIFITETYE